MDVLFVVYAISYDKETSNNERKNEMTKTEKHMEICKELNNIYIKKNHDYGDSFHATYLEEGMAMPRIR